MNFMTEKTDGEHSTGPDEKKSKIAAKSLGDAPGLFCYRKIVYNMGEATPQHAP